MKIYQVKNMSEESCIHIMNYLTTKIQPIETYLKENCSIVASINDKAVTEEKNPLLISIIVDEEEKLSNLTPLMLENICIHQEDKVHITNSYIRESLIEGAKDVKSLSFILEQDHFEQCVFININFDESWWGCIFTSCQFINCKINDSYFCNNNKIEASIGFDESTYVENKKILEEYYPMACPSEGSFIAWKKVRSIKKFDKGPRPYLVKLYIPEDAQRTSSFSNKCRASKAIVLDIINPKTMKSEPEVDVCSIQHPNFEYQVGETVEPEKPFEPDRFIECGPGIHFFLNKYEALHY